MNGYQERRNGKWTNVIKINEVYEEGCVENPGDVERVTRTEHCYCRGALCNDAAVVASSVLAIITGIGLLVLR
ncbi:hypothetical protein OBRU01_11619 [Operophtera brumata]|uniref:Protein quiver n=1 Tax=Operophtera brumata TaxID=104452 RepID=A0A0L7K3L5_OPEBR|nr:hypothetical protein OBRU01_26555 [Operophtera brumata]KOB72898.1 hypothetical protein OBRU01_11619 [Operophtera brumata]